MLITPATLHHRILSALVKPLGPSGRDFVKSGRTHPARPAPPEGAGKPPTPEIVDDAFEAGTADTLLGPGLLGLNDHTFFRDAGGGIHLLGIRNPFRSRKLFHAVAERWKGPYKRLDPIPRGRGEVGMWAPGAIVRDGTVHVFYTDPRGFSPRGWTDRWRINRMTAPVDRPTRWTHEGIVFEGYGHIRDPFVLRDPESGLYLLYFHRTTGDGTTSSVSYRTSENLTDWSAVTYDGVVELPSDLPGGCAESPHVVHRGGWYYLFVTHTSQRHYARTKVWAGRDPFWFGGPHDFIAMLWAHAPEVIDAGDDRWLITHAGHRLHAVLNSLDRRFRTPGIEVATLRWREDGP